MLGDWIARLGDDPRAEAAHVLQAKLARIFWKARPPTTFSSAGSRCTPSRSAGTRIWMTACARTSARFIQGGVLGFEPKILKDVDRGKDVSSAPWLPQVQRRTAQQLPHHAGGKAGGKGRYSLRAFRRHFAPSVLGATVATQTI